MYDGIKLFLEWVGYFFIAYLIGYSTFLFLSVVVGSLELYKHRRQEMLKSILPSDYYLPISIIVPAYNEEVTVADTVRSLLALEYRSYEIIVVDDGSKDRTSEVLAETFDMHLVHRPIRRQINCQREEYVYETRAQKVPVTLIRKKNGGKADALNMGINAANFPYFICMDADSVLQYDSLRRIAQPILENGNVVALDDKVVEVHGVDLDVTRHVIDLVADAAAPGEHNVGLVVCGLKSAYVQRSDKPFLDEVGKYYAALSIVDDLHEVLDFAQEPSAYTPDGDAEIVLKLAILDLDGSERFTNEKLTHLRADYQVVVSGKLWVDIMNIETDKKQGVEALQRVLGVTPAQTAVFGDYLNDLLMLEAGDWSFAMGNAHPDLKAAARYIAPSNVEHGVLKVVDRLVA